MAYAAKVVLDSITHDEVRLTTMELTYPLIIHNEFLTHRALGRSDEKQFDEWLEFSRNSSSNRAIPSSRIIEEVLRDPYIPLRWGRSTTGMVPGVDLDTLDATLARDEWLDARDDAVRHVEALDKRYHVAKQWRNRILTPFQWITVVATANEEMWNHYFGLRLHPTAQDEIRHVSELAEEVYTNSIPILLKDGAWHLPYLAWDENDNSSVAIAKSAARCARTSHLRQGEVFSERDDLRLYEDLRYPASGNPHASPLEHQAMATSKDVRSGNFVGWLQNRKVQGI